MADYDDEELSGPKFRKSKGRAHSTGFIAFLGQNLGFVVVFVLGLILGLVLAQAAEPFLFPEKARLEKDLQDYKLANQYYDGQVDCLVQVIEASTLSKEELQKCGV
ncbi:MAG: hypothetical protein HY393_04120 [Candidatus Diapherotrites archaeon]|nr:hypothetical protein [Candidatus Diapherotrites archaeon]